MEIEYFFDEIETCECIGEFTSEYVYDIEVDDETHTFIANDILVHNSLYISYEPLMKSVGFDTFCTTEEGRRFILHVDEVYVKPMFLRFLEEYASLYGVKNLHDFELETISKSALFIKKKHYLLNLVYEDGTFHDDLSYYYPKGIEIIRSSTPPFVRKNIYRVINYLFKNVGKIDVRPLMKIVKDVRNEFALADIEDVSMTTSLNNYEHKCLSDQSYMKFVNGAHFSVKASGFHNFLLNKNPEYKKKYDLLKQGRVKYYYCKHPQAEVFAYSRSFHPIEVVEKEKVIFDVDTQFEKTFLPLVNKFLIPIGIQPLTKRLSVMSGLLGGLKL